MVKIFIDPGHGGSDPGAVANGLKEKDLTLTISKKILSLLSNYDVSIKLSRTGDTYPSLSERAKMANDWGADYFVSIHINSGGGTGFESYVYTSVNSATVAYQNVIHAEIIKAIGGVKDRGKKRANYAVLRETNMPAILTENLFIDNANDAKKLRQDSFLNQVAQGHVTGLVKAIGLRQKLQPTQKKIYFYTGGYRGSALVKVHDFISNNGWWFVPERLNDGSIAFLVGEFTPGTEKANTMENFLKENGFWYEVR
ncbi:N-acetylmuramoyl-L-alanine amidase [Caldifermentibacillus hisashii]|uniref:N-acetylmuramoyl-L-alanine amidase n=1 Tax=Caldifermentibacillus hisashii TaxID=996558 RepID=UPI0031FCF895